MIENFGGMPAVFTENKYKSGTVPGKPESVAS